MPNLGLKLNMAVPSYANKWLWARTITTTTTTTNPSTITTTTTNTSLPRKRRRRASTLSSSSLSLNRDNTLITATIYSRRNHLRITHFSPCAPSAHVSIASPQSLTLGSSFHHNCLSLSPSSSYSSTFASFSSSSSEIREGFSGSSSPSESDMGSENKDHHHDWAAGEVNGKQSPQQYQQRHSSNKFLTLPTVLTLGRVAAVPLLIGTFYVDSWWGTTATTSIFVAAAITDWLDGYIARKMRLFTIPQPTRSVYR